MHWTGHEVSESCGVLVNVLVRADELLLSIKCYLVIKHEKSRTHSREYDDGLQNQGREMFFFLRWNLSGYSLFIPSQIFYFCYRLCLPCSFSYMDNHPRVLLLLQYNIVTMQNRKNEIRWI